MLTVVLSIILLILLVKIGEYVYLKVWISFRLWAKAWGKYLFDLSYRGRYKIAYNFIAVRSPYHQAEVRLPMDYGWHVSADRNISRLVFKNIAKRDKFFCVWCKRKTKKRPENKFVRVWHIATCRKNLWFEREHLIAKLLGGNNKEVNVYHSCHYCNSEKGYFLNGRFRFEGVIRIYEKQTSERIWYKVIGTPFYISNRLYLKILRRELYDYKF